MPCPGWMAQAVLAAGRLQESEKRKIPSGMGEESGALWEKGGSLPGWLAALREDDRKRREREREKAGWIMAYWKSDRICQGKNSDGQDGTRPGRVRWWE